MRIARRRRIGPVCFALALAACTDPPTEPRPPAEPNTPERTWTFLSYPADGGPPTAVDSGAQTGGEVHAFHEFGFDRMSIGGGRVAFGEVFSSADGKSYFVSTEDAGGLAGTTARLVQAQSFKRKPGQATLKLHVTEIELLGHNHNRDPACANDPGFCSASLTAGITFSAIAYTGSGHFFSRGSSAFLRWRRNAWELSVPSQMAPFWSAGNFIQAFEAEAATVTLAGTVTIPVDLSSVAEGEEFTLRVSAEATTYNTVGRESFARAHFRDPLSLDGATLEFEGLEPTNRPLPEPPAGTFGAAPECTTPTPGAGALQFAAPAFSLGESSFGGADGVVVTRTGGTSGAVSATVTTSNGTAVAGTDYRAVTTTVAFADGDAGPRTVPVPVFGNTRVESDRTVNLALSDPRGCATLGPATSVLTIHDDDTPPTPSGFPIAGTVTGLTGSGLVLRNVVSGEELAVGGGAFTFTRRTPERLEYDVVVATQPAGPAQVCTVANGRGTQGDTPVTNVLVTCTTPTSVGALDPTFGIEGKVATPLNGEAEAVVIQPDGKIVVAGHSTGTAPGTGGSADFTVLRYNPDGSPDASFGTGGVATAGFPAGRTDEALDVALQADGRIVVVGTTQAAVAAGGDVDFGVARFTADGRLDASFGAGGLVSTDFGPGSATANGVAVQPDGRIVVVGNARLNFNTDFALARYNADGTPDPTFGSGGRVTTNIAGGTKADLGLAVALAPGGKIVVVGRTELGGGRGDDVGLARYNADGTLDAGFGSGGVVTTDIGNGTQQANDVAVLADGRIVVAGYSGLGGTGSFDLALARYNADGTLDASFGTAGTVATDLSGHDDFAEGLALQADGRLVVIGRQTSGTTFSDLALVRYNSDGTLDPSFGTAGKLAVDFFGAADLGQGVAIQADGKIVGAGHARNGTARNYVLVRVGP